jgi:hypothetical protein
LSLDASKWREATETLGLKCRHQSLKPVWSTQLSNVGATVVVICVIVFPIAYPGMRSHKKHLTHR